MTSAGNFKPATDPLFSFEAAANEEEREIAALEPAWGKAAHFFRTGRRFGHRRRSLKMMSLTEVHALLEVYRARAAQDDTLSLLQAIKLCADENLALPTWLADAFSARLTAFLQPGRMRSLDEVFYSEGLPTSSPKKAATVRQDWQLGVRLFHDAWELAQDDEAFLSFDAVVERLLKSGDYGVRKTKAKALITMIEKSQSDFLQHEVSLSRFLENRRKRMKS